MTTDKSRADALTETKLPDGSGFAVASLPLPHDHWLYEGRSAEWDCERDTSADTPHPILTHAHRDAVVAAVRYAVRGATMCGKEADFDPDALVLNAVYALCGPHGRIIEDVPTWKRDIQKVIDSLDPEDWCGDESMISVLERALAASPVEQPAAALTEKQRHAVDEAAKVLRDNWEHGTAEDLLMAFLPESSDPQPAAAPIATHIVETEWPVKQAGIPHPSDKPAIMTCAPAQADARVGLTADAAMACFRESLIEQKWNVTASEISAVLTRARSLLATPQPEPRAEVTSERAVFDEWWRDNSPLTWDDARELAISKVNAWKGWQGRAESATNTGMENKPIAWLVLDCIYLKPCFVTLDYEDISEHRPEHVIPLYARTGASS